MHRLHPHVLRHQTPRHSVAFTHTQTHKCAHIHCTAGGFVCRGDPRPGPAPCPRNQTIGSGCGSRSDNCRRGVLLGEGSASRSLASQGPRIFTGKTDSQTCATPCEPGTTMDTCAKAPRGCPTQGKKQSTEHAMLCSTRMHNCTSTCTGDCVWACFTFLNCAINMTCAARGSSDALCQIVWQTKWRHFEKMHAKRVAFAHSP
jgi:hypothetical protein